MPAWMRCPNHVVTLNSLPCFSELAGGCGLPVLETLYHTKQHRQKDIGKDTRGQRHWEVLPGDSGKSGNQSWQC